MPMETPAGRWIEGAEMPMGRNTRALRCLHTEGWRVTEKCYFPDRVMPPHAHDVASVTYCLSGSINETFGNHREVGRAGSSVIKPVGTEHANRVGPHGARVLELKRVGSDPVPAFTYTWRHGGPVALTFLRIYREFRQAGDRSALLISELCGSFLEGTEDARGVAGPAWIRALRDRLHDAGGRITSLSELAQAFDMHPTYMARAFRRRYGCSISDYARGIRVEQAAGRLSRRSPEPLAHIALDAGFADQSHLTRTFRTHTGMTPAVYRDLVRD